MQGFITLIVGVAMAVLIVCLGLALFGIIIWSTFATIVIGSIFIGFYTFACFVIVVVIAYIIEKMKEK